MRYVSTRGDAPVLDYSEALLTGLALDGGLYVPETWPQLTGAQLELCGEAPYHEAAAEVIWQFAAGSSIDRPSLDEMTAAAYSTFRHDDVVPTRQLTDNEHLLELFWGPTLSFKDVALQLLGRLFEFQLAKSGDYVTIVGATSGDTGSAAIEACRDRAGIELVMLHPEGRVSEVQRRQMTTVDAPNIHNIAVKGHFDDCQDLVKAMFADRAFRDEVHLSAVNSINWARVSAQVVYYVRTAVRLGAGEPVSFTVPTGNFGNILAAYVARRMGAPIGRLVIASNENDILTRTHSTGSMTMDGVTPTTSPAMDIQVSSNFERLLFDLYGRDGAALADAMREFRHADTLALPEQVAASFAGDFVAGRASESDVAATIAAVHTGHGVLIDPHTAVGVHVGRTDATAGAHGAETMVYVSTAHPAKFPDAVIAATGVVPQLPEHLADLDRRVERYDVAEPHLAQLQTMVRSLR